MLLILKSIREKVEKFMLPIQDTKLITVWKKVQSGILITEDDLWDMLSTNDMMGLGYIAGYVRTSLHGKKGFYGVNMNLNYTNICELRCPLCAFSCDRNSSNAYLYSLNEIEDMVRKEIRHGIDEVHIVGGLHPDLKLDYFEEMLHRIKKLKKDIFIVAFTPVEYDYFSKKNRISIEEVFQRLIASGLGALPGGGAEIFAEDKRIIIAPKKISGTRWLEIMKIAHSFGLKSNATLLYNHIEDKEDVVEHLSQLRMMQEQTGGFKSFVPLLYHDENTQIKAKKKSSTGFDTIRLYASARIFLHNIPHIKALWMYIGEKMAQVLLNFGVDDIGATYNYEKVVHSAGANTPDLGTENFLRRLIESAGFAPTRVTSSYEEKNEVRTVGYKC